MSFRYQPVYTETEVGRFYSVCEVYLDDSGALHSWTDSVSIAPTGNDHEDLRGSLIRMLYEVEKWAPVEHEQLHVGQTFKRRDQPEPTP